jgi:septum formation protein
MKINFNILKSSQKDVQSYASNVDDKKSARKVHTDLGVSLDEAIKPMQIPMSPTDGLLSPTSMKVKFMHKKMPKAEVFHKKSYDLVAGIPRLDLPLPNSCPLILGSSSSSRQNVLEVLNWPFTVMPPDIDEKAIRSENLNELPVLIAKAKAAKLLQKLKESELVQGPCVLITADQIVSFKGKLREKPVNIEQAKEYLASYSKESVTTLSAVVVTHYPSERQASDLDSAVVTWGEINKDVITSVIKRGEVLNCAGGFRIEDPDLNPLIQNIEGSIDSVVGLPVEKTVQLIEAVMNEETNPLISAVVMQPYRILESDLDGHHEKGRHVFPKSWDRSRSNTHFDRSRSNTVESRPSSRTRALTARSEFSDITGRNRALTARSDGCIGESAWVPSSPTDHVLSPVSMKIQRKMSPSLKSLMGSSTHSKRIFSLQTDVTRKHSPVNSPTQLILASHSSIKKEVLQILNWDFSMLPYSIQNNTTIQNNFSCPQEYAETIAKEKVASVVTQLQNLDEKVVIATHQIAIFQANIRESPKTKEEAISFLLSYSNEFVTMLTAVVVTHHPSGRQAYDSDLASIHWKEINEDVARTVSQRELTFNCPGAFRFDDPDLNPLIKDIEGPVDSIVGMPIEVIVRLIQNVL